MTRSEAKTFRTKLDNALKTLAKETGYKLEVGSISFGANNFSAKIKGAEISDDGIAKTPEREALKFTEFNYGDRFQWGTETYKITGYKRRSRKYPVLAESEKTGRTYKFQADSVRAYMI